MRERGRERLRRKGEMYIKEREEIKRERVRKGKREIEKGAD